MKVVGMILISIGLALGLFVIYSFMKERNKIISPIPQEQGVKVIFVTPQATTSQ